MSYVLAGNKFYDSEAILAEIKEKYQFKIVKDITKGSKRDDTLVYQIIQDVEVLKEDFLLEEVGPIEEEDLVDELMNLADEKVSLIEGIIPDEFICYSYSYYYDEGLGEIKCIFIALDKKVGDLRLMDIAERILRSVD